MRVQEEKIRRTVFRKMGSLLCLIIAAVVCLFPAKAQADDTVELNRKSISVYQTTTRQLELLNAEGDVTWKSSNPKVASVDENGCVSTYKAGKCTIAARYMGKKYTCAVTVKAVKLNASSLKLVRGRSWQLKLSRSALKPVWVSSNPKVATVDEETGLVQAIAKGSCTIAAKYRNVTWKCKVTVLKVGKSALTQMYPVKKNQGKILLAGSSSLDYWRGAYAAFAPNSIINMGIHGTTVTRWMSYYQTMITRYNPSAVVLYVGSNDIGTYDVSGRMNAKNTQKLISLIRKKLPKVPIFYVSVVPTYTFDYCWDEVFLSNRLMKNYCAQTKNVYYLDLASHFLDEDGVPDDDLFRDGHHPNAKGYALWKEYVAKPVIKEVKRRAKSKK